MFYGSVTFLFLFLPVTLLIYYIVPARFKNPVLLAASLFFYAWGSVIYVPLLFISIAVNYGCGRAIGARRGTGRGALSVLVAATAFNLALLVVFSYVGSLAAASGASSQIATAFAELAVPIGISFFTLQAISYLVDVYRGNVSPQRNFLRLALYISLFTQLIAGPVVRYSEMEQQLQSRKLSWSQFGEGAFRFLIGLAKNTVLANGIAAIFSTASAQVLADQAVCATAWIGAVSFMLQIYLAFSGYADMAVGLGLMFGFRFRNNFRHPYTAKNMTGFLKTWNISLGRWFREYVWLPLGGSWAGAPRWILNLLLAAALSGLWYGGSLTMLVWGLYCGVILILERYVWGKGLSKIPAFVQHLYTLALLVVGWVFFFSESMADAIHYLSAMFGTAGTQGSIQDFSYLLSSGWLLLAVGALCCTAIPTRLLSLAGDNGKRRAVYIAAAIALFVLAAACLVAETNHPFLYFRF